MEEQWEYTKSSIWRWKITNETVSKWNNNIIPRLNLSFNSEKLDKPRMTRKFCVTFKFNNAKLEIWLNTAISSIYKQKSNNRQGDNWKHEPSVSRTKSSTDGVSFPNARNTSSGEVKKSPSAITGAPLSENTFRTAPESSWIIRLKSSNTLNNSPVVAKNAWYFSTPTRRDVEVQWICFASPNTRHTLAIWCNQ